MGAPAPHSPQTVLELAAHAATTSFDPSRPLWEFTLVENLEGERAALVLKVHHSLTDGVGGIELAMRLFDLEPGDRLDANLPPLPEPEQTDLLRLAGEAFVHSCRLGVSMTARNLRAAGPTLARSLLRPRVAIAEVVETTYSIARTVAPVRQTLSPVMTRRGLGRRLDMVEVDLDDLKQAAATAGGTVNDAFVTAVTGALRRYHERHDVCVEDLRVTLPISVRKPDDPVGGNRITLMRFRVPVSDADPIRRMESIHKRCQAAAQERSLAFTDTIAGVLRMLPSGVVGSMLKRIDFLASDVAGFPGPVYLGDARVERLVSFSPTVGASINVTLLSYDGKCCIGVNADTAAVPDPSVFTECLVEGLEETLSLAGSHSPVQVPAPTCGCQ